MLLTVIPGIVLALFLALLVEKPLRGMAFFRTLIISPVTVSAATASTIGLLLFNPSVSILTYGLKLFGVQEIAWLTDPFWAMLAVSGVTVWLGLGFHTILLLGALQSIPEEIRESALLDGAGFWRIFRKIILPLSPPILIVTVIWQFTNIWNEFLFGASFSDFSSFPLTVALNNLVNSSTGIKEYNVHFAGAFIAAVPTLVVYVLSGKYFVRGLMAGSVKG